MITSYIELLECREHDIQTLLVKANHCHQVNVFLLKWGQG